MPERYFLGVDIGTYESKGVLINQDYDLVESFVVKHNLENPKPKYFEHDAEGVWWSDFCQISRMLIAESNIDPKEIVISLKTTTKDRMPKIFIDKILMERFLNHPIRMVGISQNDIQRKENKGEITVSYTFVSNLFMVYTKFLTELEGYYYLDIPKRALESPFNRHIFPFSKFILKDIWNLLSA